jgi:divalent metal cation (Fe/Co/Zn/Cd) transporter
MFHRGDPEDAEFEFGIKKYDELGALCVSAVNVILSAVSH